VFWSGGNAAKSAAEEWATANGGVTLGMTPAGQAMESATQGMEWSEAQPLWSAASRDFAQQAAGEVHVFQNAAGVSINSIWATQEYPALMENPYVSGIAYHVVGAP
jgi:roadblock/LC7 domain-containing protein